MLLALVMVLSVLLIGALLFGSPSGFLFDLIDWVFSRGFPFRR
jgi:hypothetical protein